MKFLVAGWSQSVDTSNALTAITALTDNVVRASGNNIVVPRGFNRLAGVYALGATLTQARLRSPSIDSGRYYRIAPFDVSATITVPTPLLDRFLSPIELTETENLTAEVAENAAGAERETVLAWFSEGKPEEVQGEIFTIKATATATLTAFAWTDCVLTFSDNLIAGRYACVGARFESAGALAGRFAPIDAGNYRPGAIAYTGPGKRDHPVFRYGGLGTWFEFEHDTPPVAQFLSASADTTETVYLDLVQIRSGSS